MFVTVPLLKKLAFFTALIEQNELGAVIATGWPAMVYSPLAEPEQKFAVLAVTESVTGPLPSAWNVMVLLLPPLKIVAWVALRCAVVNDASICAVSVVLVGIGRVATEMVGTGCAIWTVADDVPPQPFPFETVAVSEIGLPLPSAENTTFGPDAHDCGKPFPAKKPFVIVQFTDAHVPSTDAFPFSPLQTLAGAWIGAATP